MDNRFLGDGANGLGTVDDGHTAYAELPCLPIGVSRMLLSDGLAQKGDTVVEVEEVLGLTLQASRLALH